MVYNGWMDGTRVREYFPESFDLRSRKKESLFHILSSLPFSCIRYIMNFNIFSLIISCKCNACLPLVADVSHVINILHNADDFRCLF